MSIPLNVRGTVYDYPTSGQDPGWGGPATDWAQAVTETLTLIVGPNDILQTSFSINNNQTTSELVRGLYFNPTQVRAANINYSVFRSTASSTTVETGELLITYDATQSVNQKWKITQRSNGSAGVLFTLDDSGQFFYTSSNIAGTSYSGILRFTARTLSI